MAREGLMDDSGWDYVSCENTDWQEKCKDCCMTECQVFQDKVEELKEAYERELEGFEPMTLYEVAFSEGMAFMGQYLLEQMNNKERR